MTPNKRLYLIIGAAILAVVAVVLVAFLAFPSKERDRGATHRDRKSPDEKRTVSGTRPEKPATPPSPPAVATPRDTTPVQLPPQLTDEERAEILEKRLFECLEELWPIYLASFEYTATREDKDKVKNLKKQINKILGKLGRLKSERAVQAYRRFAFRNKGKKIPPASGDHIFDGFIGGGINPFFLAQWDAPGARDLLFDLLHAFDRTETYYSGIIEALGEVKDEKERAKKELLAILSTYPWDKPAGSFTGSHWIHLDAMNSLEQLDPDAQMAAFEKYVKDEKRSFAQRRYIMDNIAWRPNKRYFKILQDVASDVSLNPDVRGLALTNLTSIVYKSQRTGSKDAEKMKKELVNTARAIYQRKSHPVTRNAAYRALLILGEVKMGDYSSPPANLKNAIDYIVRNANRRTIAESSWKTTDATAKSLREYTDRNFGYLEAKSDKERVAAAAKWKEWYEKNKEGIRWNQEKYKYEVTKPEGSADTPESSEDSSESE